MNEAASAKFQAPDSNEALELMAKIAEQGGRVLRGVLARKAAQQSPSFHVVDKGELMRTFQEVAPRIMANPGPMLETQLRFWQDCWSLWGRAALRSVGQSVAPVATAEPDDKRFKDDAWEENTAFDFIKQAYLLTGRFVLESVGQIDGLDPHTEKKLVFYTRQLVDALSPTNFAFSNPRVVRQTLESGGMNLLRGFSNLLEDLERGEGRLRMRMTDESRFTLGENVAVTPGKVVFQNELIQLLQYSPATEKVHRRPLLIVPPWINKYYILDLRPKNSFIKWAVEQGHTVFVISWVNPDQSLAEKGFEEYMFEGPLAALDAIEQATGERKVKAIGYCLGGTLLAATLAWMKTRDDRRIKAATFFASMMDFSEPGDLGVFIDEEQLARMDEQMERDGYFEGSAMAEAFNLLRANDLIWSFAINNYLMGQDPFPFDLLYWNSDSTRMPRNMHSFYLRKMYLENLLCEPGGISIDEVPIDLGAVDTPAYILSTKDDHIAPWKSTFAATRLFSGPVRFVLGASGHIAGVINPPAANKYGYWTNDNGGGDPEEWLGGASEHAGSWWLDWSKWISRYNGKKVPARVPGDGTLEVLEEAPGSYVKERIV